MYIINISKEQIPYITDVEINGKLFKLGFNYNLYDNRIYIDLYDENGNVLSEDEPIVLGQILFSRYYIDNATNFRNEFPKALIIPNFFDSSVIDVMTYDNLEQWALYVEEIK